MAEPTLFDQLGGEPALRRIVDRFVDRIFDDVMIGFFFRNASRERVKEKEYEFAARHLGANLPYTGRPIREAHAPHPIMGGQFNRRMKILEETLVELGAPENVKRHWLAHTEALRGQVTRNAGNDCDPTFGEVTGKGKGT
ncbi:MAG TPA: group 1 truncated hemoglobin [Polyangiaceae bacterium]|nr:group 1 truncated hemoglobin [Polyangiaceae bacterium]